MEEQHGRRRKTRTYFSIVLILQEQFCTSELSKVIPGRNLIDPSLQYNVVIPDGFFKYFYHVGCAINFHSIINSGLIPGGQNLRNRQTVLFLPVDPMDKEHKDPDHDRLGSTASCTVHAYNMEGNTKTRCIGSTSNLLKRKDLRSIRHDRTPSFFMKTLPGYCIPKVVQMETGDVIYEKSICFTSTSSKDFLET